MIQRFRKYPTTSRIYVNTLEVCHTRCVVE